ncbi:GxGYxYP domain-containing protein [Novipirellula artificiosorum]|uniref:GxGYxYP putative glycoside hydrolase N-terminal domain-containing protein n=1 Tax=Novipirellula artificiosorum TaxID=2528016 RepID=A0A5C6D6Q8_9BACT|nr:GxGYxYP domain-containing protein [Novipirellula artificiosorum]TWU32873.1 hypothetical protein Poly41_52500 [Novipirellula artificiosorum]
MTQPKTTVTSLFLSLMIVGVAIAKDRSPQSVHLFDAKSLRGLDLSQTENANRVWDTLHAFAALQGIVNRDEPRLYLSYCREFGVDTDRFWLNWLRHDDGWLGNRSVVAIDSLAKAVETFRSQIDGVVVYDPAVPATSNVASTAAGCEKLIPVRFSRDPDSLYVQLTTTLGLPVKLWLIHPDGSSMFASKAEAYRWAIREFIESGKCDPLFSAYYVDAFWLTRPSQATRDMHTLTNHDYFVSHRAFFFDLSPWGDEAPVDEPSQPMGLDKQVLIEVLSALQLAAPKSILKIGGFPPWPFKYTTHGGAGKHGGVPTEWEFTRLISQYNAYHEADAAAPGAMANASFFAHYPLRESYPQPNARPTARDWQRAGYIGDDGKVAAKLFVGHYVGDYDSPAWLYKAVPAFFSDPQRGQVPLAWAFDPNLSDRAPQAMVYAYQHATHNDFFVAGDSGAGYLNPRALSQRPDSMLPSGLAFWRDHNRTFFKRWGMTITGFVLDGAAGGSTELEFQAYRDFSPDGCGCHHGWPAPPTIISGVPVCPHRDLPSSAADAAALIAAEANKVNKGPRFLWGRSILKPPSWYAEVSKRVEDDYPEADVEVVDPYTFFGLAKRDAESRSAP